MDYALAQEFRARLAVALCQYPNLQDAALMQLIGQLNLELLSLLPSDGNSFIFEWFVWDGFKYPSMGLVYPDDALLLREEHSQARDRICQLAYGLLGFRHVVFVDAGGLSVARLDGSSWVVEEISSTGGVA